MKGHVKVVEFFLKQYPDMSELINREGRNILHVAALSGKAKMVAYMLKRNDLEMLINGKDKKGNTPLHLASMAKHPMVVSNLTWDKRVNLSSLNILNMTAYDIALEFRDIFAFREQLTWLALRYAGARRAPPSVLRKKPQCLKLKMSDVLNEYKDLANTLVVVATLVITVTFAAAFTMPGGYNGSGGVATFLERHMFHLFAICNSTAMCSAITVVALIWAQQRDLGLFDSAFKFAVPMLGLTLTIVSMAFMASNYLVLRNLHWLAYLVLIIGSFFILALSILYFPLCLLSSPQNLIARYTIYFAFYLVVKASWSDADDWKEE
ncbi:protein ACCELERATED CELL DEATH 6 [Quercus suber]|uniref:protein ACCELERATED CELL DEATH 6 n=1 Tax=Quercus suber TaxID=58331 RepID=UPI000CE17591|nr:protein ACCELERATED CELL DEATH 6-like [Quercus suber]